MLYVCRAPDAKFDELPAIERFSGRLKTGISADGPMSEASYTDGLSPLDIGRPCLRWTALQHKLRTRTACVHASASRLLLAIRNGVRAATNQTVLALFARLGGFHPSSTYGAVQRRARSEYRRLGGVQACTVSVSIVNE